MAIAVETEVEWDGIEELKDRIKNPEKYAGAAPVAAAPTSSGPAEEAKKEEESEEESDDDMGLDLFG